jgi:hypothetical protein
MSQFFERQYASHNAGASSERNSPNLLRDEWTADLCKAANGILPLIECLGMRRIVALAVVARFVAGTIFPGTMFLGRLSMEAVEAAPEAKDVSRMGAALQGAGVRFDAHALPEA